MSKTWVILLLLTSTVSKADNSRPVLRTQSAVLVNPYAPTLATLPTTAGPVPVIVNQNGTAVVASPQTMAAFQASRFYYNPTLPYGPQPPPNNNAALMGAVMGAAMGAGMGAGGGLSNSAPAQSYNYAPASNNNYVPATAAEQPASAAQPASATPDADPTTSGPAPQQSSATPASAQPTGGGKANSSPAAAAPSTTAASAGASVTPAADPDAPSTRGVELATPPPTTRGLASAPSQDKKSKTNTNTIPQCGKGWTKDASLISQTMGDLLGYKDILNKNLKTNTPGHTTYMNMNVTIHPSFTMTKSANGNLRVQFVIVGETMLGSGKKDFTRDASACLEGKNIRVEIDNSKETDNTPENPPKMDFVFQKVSSTQVKISSDDKQVDSTFTAQ